MTYQAVLFDLFDTLVLFHRERLPEIHVNGRTVRSTAGHLHAAFRPFAPHVELPAFMDALFWSWQEAERIRSDAHREVSAPERFGMLFRRLELEPSVEARDLLLATHMRELSKVVECPDHHAPLLKALRERYRLAVVSLTTATCLSLAVSDAENTRPARTGMPIVSR